jgi:hypothetical protein
MKRGMPKGLYTKHQKYLNTITKRQAAAVEAFASPYVYRGRNSGFFSIGIGCSMKRNHLG